jgi:hypothetical protein
VPFASLTISMMIVLPLSLICANWLLLPRFYTSHENPAQKSLRPLRTVIKEKLQTASTLFIVFS